MIQIFADGARVYDSGLKDYCSKDNVLVYDSRLEEYDLQGLKVTTGLNKGGLAEIVMPPQHPYYEALVGYRTIVRIYRDGQLRFRGRALYPTDDYNNIRTMTCEGELCFLQDAISRPAKYNNTPQAIFTDLVAKYNNQVDTFKQFKTGTVDVTTPSNVLLELEEAETILATVEKLLEQCGGYIVFTTDNTGAREINWRSSFGKDSEQTIDAGENLFDFSRTGANTEMATALVPYGAKNSAGRRVTIMNAGGSGGVDYIVDEEAAAFRGKIFKTVTWDDVTSPADLLAKAQEYLAANKLFVTSLTLSALDLSYVDKTVESFKVGDKIKVISRAHGVNDYFQLVESTEDLLNPSGGLITLGKEVRTLTGITTASEAKNQSNIQKTASGMQTIIGSVEQKADAALEQQAQNIEALATSMSAAETSISALDTSLKTLDSSLKTLEARVKTLEDSKK